jgi:hypothetical protein
MTGNASSFNSFTSNISSWWWGTPQKYTEVCPDMHRELDINLPSTLVACDIWYMEYYRQLYETSECIDDVKKYNY